MSLLLVFLAFNFIIFFHEFGHFIVAKMCGMKVNEFSMFIGPKLFSFKRAETTYSIRLLPIMAYVKLEGEDEKSKDENAFNRKPVWQKISVIFAGPFVNIITAFLLIAVVYSLTGFQTNIISDVLRGTPAQIEGIKPGDEIYSIDGRRVYTAMDTILFTYITKGNPAEVVVKRDGKIRKYTLTPEKDPAVYYLGLRPSETMLVESFSEESPAKEANIQIGDKIMFVNGVEAKSINDILYALRITKNELANVVVERNGEAISFDIKPLEVVNEGLYELFLAFEFNDVGEGNILKQAYNFTWSNIRNVFYTFGWLVKGEVKATDLTGPVGIVSSMNDVVKSSVQFKDMIIKLLQMTAYISVAIGTTNLIPFPALDGGRLVLLFIEGLRRKPLSVEKEAAIHSVGFVLLIIVAIMVTYKDILRITT